MRTTGSMGWELPRDDGGSHPMFVRDKSEALACERATANVG